MRWAEVLPEDVERVAALGERRLSAEEFEAYVAQPMTEEERAEIEGLLDWFARRYPTPALRLEYARRAYRRWTAQRRSAVPR